MKKTNIKVSTTCSYFTTPLVASYLSRKDIVMTTMHENVTNGQIRHFLNAQHPDAERTPHILGIDRDEGVIHADYGTTPWCNLLQDHKAYALPKDKETDYYVTTSDFDRWGPRFINETTQWSIMSDILGHNDDTILAKNRDERVKLVASLLKVACFSRIKNIHDFAEQKERGFEDTVAPHQGYVNALSEYDLNRLIKRCKNALLLKKMSDWADEKGEYSKYDFPGRVYKAYQERREEIRNNKADPIHANRRSVKECIH
jgi:hypothetical protein